VSDPRNVIQGMFATSSRYGNFGDVIVQIHIQGVRCHQNTIIDVESPIVAICGLNGTGKSTALQLAAVAYQNDSEVYYVKDFMVEGPLDPSPFSETTSVKYLFWNRDRDTTQRTLSRNNKTKRWSEYSDRLTRRVFFAGIGKYLPKIEQHDFIVNNAENLLVSDSQKVTEDIKRWICNVLACDYEEVTINTVTYSDKNENLTGQVVSVQRSGKSYSESHMGFGEGRTQYLISALENLPNQSLVLIEEPETSLHPSAQHQFAHYLMDVVSRKRHQIFLTTHSPFILKALPTQSRVYLKRNGEQIDVLRGLSAAQIRSLLAEGNEKALDILVEDLCAKAVLSEFVRKIDPAFLQTIEIIPAGAAQTIASFIKALDGKLSFVVAVLDADMPHLQDTQKNIFCLPGDEKKPPEQILFSDSKIRTYVQEQYGVNMADFSAQTNNLDHHGWIDRLAQRVSQTPDALLSELARVYANSHENFAQAITEQLKATLK
jgi:predicted ATPase